MEFLKSVLYIYGKREDSGNDLNNRMINTNFGNRTTALFAHETTELPVREKLKPLKRLSVIPPKTSYSYFTKIPLNIHLFNLHF